MSSCELQRKMSDNFYVIKRDGTREVFDINKISERIEKFVKFPYSIDNVDVVDLSHKAISGLSYEIKTSEIDNYIANLASSLGIQHRDYLILASRIIIDDHHKMTDDKFSSKMIQLYNYHDSNNNHCPLITKDIYDFIVEYGKEIDREIDYSRDFLLDYFGFKTLQNGYLIKINNKLVERPQDLFMRSALQMYYEKNPSDKIFKKIKLVYDMISQQYYTPATPTLFNSCTPRGNLASCFLLGSHDSLEGIMKTLTDSVQISKWSGGIGLHASMWRAEGSLIRGTNGASSGIIPFLRLYNDGARAFNQGGKRNGSFAVYLEPHHPDIMKFLELRLPHGDENLRCRDLFLALWVSDLFMQRVSEDKEWSVFCPDECSKLNEVWGDEYEMLYTKYEQAGKARAVYSARELLFAIYKSQKESGQPYICFKDTINKTSMQNNIGVIQSSNLCVSGDTHILTDNGYVSIRELCSTGPIHNVWNGQEFTSATFAKTGENQTLLEVRTQFTFVKCTPYHKFILRGENETEKIVEARELQVGDVLTTAALSNTNPKYGLYNVIQSIRVLEEKEDTYCFNEPKKNRGVFNGLILGNCAEITLVSNTKEYAMCNLSSICLSKYVVDTSENPNHEFPSKPMFDYKKLAEVAGDITENLNQVIDRTYYPTVETAISNFRNRPIGIGIQGLADVFMKFKIPFDSDEARKINKTIAEAIYYGALSRSTKLAKEKYKTYKNYIYTDRIVQLYPSLENENIYNPRDTRSGSYPSYSQNGGSHLYNGMFHWELYGLTSKDLSGLFDWETLRSHIKTFGVRNSMTTAYMPTASTSQIMSNSSCFEPYVANIYERKTKAGNYIIFNKYLIHDLQSMGLWNDTLRTYLLKNNGSIQSIAGLPQKMKDVYRTAWEIKQRNLMQMAAERQPFIDQSQSMNLFMENFTQNTFSSMIVCAWKLKLKTGNYYIKTKEAIMPQKFTLDVDVGEISSPSIVEYDDDDICLLCSS